MGKRLHYADYSATVLLIFFLALLPLNFIDRKASIMAINQWHHPWTDFFFQYVTHLGLGSVYAALVVALLFHRFHHALTAMLVGLLHGGLSAFLKRQIFPFAKRPIAFFDDLSGLHLVEGVTIHELHSFPSGHTATAFAMAFVIARVFQNKRSLYAALLLACCIGYSRMYLFQHFLVDVYFGALLGTTVAAVCCYLTDAFFSTRNLPWLQANLFTVWHFKADTEKTVPLYVKIFTRRRP
jgi:membrane-associated phospholipid phosphatase